MLLLYGYIQCYIVSCRHPLERRDDHESSIQIMNLSYPITEGTSVQFSCSKDLELIQTGPNATTCMSNGQWEPDPRAVECKSNLP